MARWLVEVHDVNGKVLLAERFLLRRNAQRRAAEIERQGREMAALITAGWTEDQRALVPDAAYTAAVRRA